MEWRGPDTLFSGVAVGGGHSAVWLIAPYSTLNFLVRYPCQKSVHEARYFLIKLFRDYSKTFMEEERAV